MFDKIGLREPDGTVTMLQHAYLENGMHYELMQDGIGYIVAADHDAVGLVNYYRIAASDWNDLIDGVHGEVTEWSSESKIYIREN